MRIWPSECSRGFPRRGRSPKQEKKDHVEENPLVHGTLADKTSQELPRVVQTDPRDSRAFGVDSRAVVHPDELDLACLDNDVCVTFLLVWEGGVKGVIRAHNLPRVIRLKYIVNKLVEELATEY